MKRLCDHGWVRPQPGDRFSMREHVQHRTYDQVACRGPAGEQVFDLYHDAVTNSWALDVAHD